MLGYQIFSAKCGFGANLQHRLHVVKPLWENYKNSKRNDADLSETGKNQDYKGTDFRDFRMILDLEDHFSLTRDVAPTETKLNPKTIFILGSLGWDWTLRTTSH